MTAAASRRRPTGPRVSFVLGLPLVLAATLLLVPPAARAGAHPADPGPACTSDGAPPAAEQARIDRALRAAGVPDADERTRAIRVPVHVHVLAGKRVTGPSRKRIRRQLAVLNRAYAGKQSRASAPSRFRFELVSLRRVRKDRWRTAGPLGADPAAARMRRALRRGSLRALNLYIGAPRGGGRAMLGYSTAPWEAVDRPRLDGVTVHRGTLPGGRLRPFHRGDTLVHEVGHWLGLLHTFAGGCTGRGDRVADTPAAAQPTHLCDLHQDTCPYRKGRDPVRNFMNYTPDACMDRFTRGQVRRMTRMWRAFRA